ncbi:MAG: hypothetical protein L6244_05015 [Candidatus Methanoperedenaceae archaeon]|nr:hypothetical protein [Euryarchaeota archaeon]MCG2727989.1 hypothetical protein [Candidatus Methanoperedenaceae archaeon]
MFIKLIEVCLTHKNGYNKPRLSQESRSRVQKHESLGSHYSVDYPEGDDANWLKHTLVTYTPEGPRIDYKPVKITMYKPLPREY